VPAIIMTGDTSPQRLRDAQSTSALLLHKPVSTSQLREAMVQLITQPQPTNAAGSALHQAEEAAATASDAAGP
jgi:CheY-like chemotaxis protein